MLYLKLGFETVQDVQYYLLPYLTGVNTYSSTPNTHIRSTVSTYVTVIYVSPNVLHVENGSFSVAIEIKSRFFDVENPRKWKKIVGLTCSPFWTTTPVERPIE